MHAGRVAFGIMAVLLPLASADEFCVPEFSEPTLQADPYYLSVDFCLPERCIASVWLYEESNGIWDLQRDDAFLDETCGKFIPPDTIVHSIWQPWPL